jgi:hypothetical protein
VDIRSSLVAHQEPAVPCQPRQRALHHPPVPPQSLAGVFSSPRDAALDAATAQIFSTAWIVVGLVCVQLLGPLAWSTPARALDRSDCVHQLLEDLRVVYVGGGEHHGEGNAVAVGQNVTLGAGLAPVGRIGPDRFAPLWRARSPSPSTPSTSLPCRTFATGQAASGADDARRPPSASPGAAASTLRHFHSPSH